MGTPGHQPGGGRHHCALDRVLQGRRHHARLARSLDDCQGQQVLLPERQHPLVRPDQSAVAELRAAAAADLLQSGAYDHAADLPGRQGPDVRRWHAGNLRRHPAADLQQRADAGLQQHQSADLQWRTAADLQRTTGADLRQRRKPDLRQRHAADLRRRPESHLPQPRAPGVQQPHIPDLRRHHAAVVQRTDQPDLRQRRSANLRQRADPDVQRDRRSLQLAAAGCLQCRVDAAGMPVRRPRMYRVPPRKRVSAGRLQPHRGRVPEQWRLSRCAAVQHQRERL